jgi:tetratricopeptide (TPR) repeat protein
MAEQLGLDEIRAHALNNIGFVRSSVGDEAGIRDLERSLEIALDRNSPECIRTYLNLGTAHSHFGDLAATFRVHEEGRREAERFGDSAGIAWLATERLWELYWRGRWDEAVALADEQLAELDAGGPRSFFEPAARLARGWISLAREQLDLALDDATRVCAFVEETRSVQGAFPALALRARTYAAVGRADDARADIDQLLRLWQRAAVVGSYWTADLAFAAVELDVGAALVEAMAGVQPTRWVEAARAVATARFARAAEVYGTIGSRPDEALARLYAAAAPVTSDRSDVARHDLERAVEFFQAVGAARYLEQAERLEAVMAS